jgi:hypothetical protein
MTTSAGQKVTVDETSSTKYQKKTNSMSASAIKKGQHILVLGTVSSTTIKATQVIVQTTEGVSTASTAATVIPFQKVAPTTSKQVGKIPANYSEGSGTIVSGTTANKATEAALASYPGGIVDRVVKLSNGEYEVHNIGVNWPHHIFVNQNRKVVGADQSPKQAMRQLKPVVKIARRSSGRHNPLAGDGRAYQRPPLFRNNSFVLCSPTVAYE